MTDKNTTRIDLRPTLIVGLGGTGHEVLVNLKARYLDAYGEDILKIVKLISFDTAEESKHAPGENGTLVQLDRGTELIHIGNVPTPNILDNLDQHPTIKAWLPNKIPGRAITAGAQQMRPMGRLALFFHFSKIRRRLEKAIRSLSNIKLPRDKIGEHGTIARSQGINIFIVASICGGTGSGMFLDMAYILRHLCQEQGLGASYSFVNGVLVMPQAFATVDSDLIRANAHTALLELDHFTKDAKFSVQYPGMMQVNINNIRPFNICYLVDTVNERGKMLAGLNELAPMLAEAIFLQTASQVGDAQQSAFDNVKTLTGVDQNRYPTAYSGLGTASAVFPADVLIDACSSLYGVNLLDNALLKNSTETVEKKEAIQKEVNSVLDKLRLTEESLKGEMHKGEKGRPMRIRINQRALNTIPVKESVGAAIKVVKNQEDRHLNDLFKTQIENNLNRLRREMAQALNQEANRIVDDRELGLDIAIGFLKALEKRLSELTNLFTDQRTALNEQIRRMEERNEGIEEMLKKAADSFLWGRKRRIQTARNTFVSHHQRRLDILLDRRIISGSLFLLAGFSNDALQPQLRCLEELQDRFLVARDRLSGLSEKLANGKGDVFSPLVRGITDASDIERYYHRFARNAMEDTHRLFKDDPLHSWIHLGYDELYNRLLNFGRSVFTDISAVDIEQVIMDKRDQTPHDVLLEELREDAIPFWNKDIARLSGLEDSLETLIVIGVRDKKDTIYQNEGESLASTHDRHAITVLTTRHGLTIYALQQHDSHKRRYERHRELQTPLHCFDVLNTPWLKTIFAIGQAFGFIKQDGNWFYIYLPAEFEDFQEIPVEFERQDKIELGVGLRNALDTFINHTSYITRAEKLIDNRIKTMGATQAKLALEKYAKPDSLPKGRGELRKVAEELQELVIKYIIEHLG